MPVYVSSGGVLLAQYAKLARQFDRETMNWVSQARDVSYGRVLMFLRSHGIGTWEAVAVVSTWKARPGGFIYAAVIADVSEPACCQIISAGCVRHRTINLPHPEVGGEPLSVLSWRK